MALNAAILSDLIKADLTSNGFDLTNEFCFASKLADAIANSVVTHIVSDSELVPLTSDSGTAGVGIITGSVK